MTTEPAAVEFPALGTTAWVLATDPSALDAARAAVEVEVAAVDGACSRFREDSDLARVNGADGRAVPVSPLFLDALDVALRAAVITDGLVDPTIGAVLREIGYDRDFATVPASGPALRATVRTVPGWRAVDVDRRRGTVRVPAGVVLDLGATAKAWCADRAAAAAAEIAGGAGVLVSLGGDIAVAGPPPAGGWAVRVTDDHRAPTDAPGQTVVLHDGGLATSGTASRRWTRGAVQLHHLIDSATAAPAAGGWRTVTVAAASCVDANIASTAAVVLGAGAPAWLTSFGLPARLVADDGTVTVVGDWPADEQQSHADGARREVTGVVLAASSKATWYLTRGTGLVTLLLLTASMVLGVVTTVRWKTPRWPRFVTAALHRNVSLLVVVFLVAHVLTSVIDAFAPIHWLDIVVPVGAAYRPLWLGLGALSVDLLVAVTITSLVRQRLGYGVWRVVHWTSYACWPAALLHGLGTGSDTKLGWVLVVNLACVAAVLAAVWWRLSVGWPADAGTRVVLGAVTVVGAVVLLAWLFNGPTCPGWARRAGTPPSLLSGAAADATSGPGSG